MTTNKMKWTAFVLGALSLLLGGVGPARATVIYDNLGAASVASGSVSVGLADSFSTGASPVNLVDVQVVLSLNSDPPNPSTVVQLLSDNSTSPGSVLTTIGSINDSSLSGTPTVYDFPLSTPFALAADTRYWIGLSTSTGSNAVWSFSYDTSGVGVGSEYFASGNGVSANAGNGPYLMQVTVSGLAVPEPSSMILCGLGAAGLLVAARRRRHKRNRLPSCMWAC